jgi:hypothetical protein
VRKTDLQTFTYYDSLGKWLGENRTMTFGHQSTLVTGFIQIAPHQPSDTTTDAEVGYLVDGTLRLMKVELNAINATDSCSTQVWADQSKAVSLAWDNVAEQETITPTADSTSGWVAPSDRVVFPDGSTVSADVVTAVGGAGPSEHSMVLHVREEVTP